MSLATKAITRYLSTLPNTFVSEEAVLASADANSDGVTPPSRLFRNCTLAAERIDGRLVITVSPKIGGSDKQLFYLHGGGYVYGTVKPHWWLIADLIKRTGATITVPMYKLIQDGGTASSEVPWLVDLYTSLAERGPVYVAGDSAGGNLSLVLCLALKDQGGQLPEAVFAFSPATDGTATNPKIQQIKAKDPMLAVPGIRWISKEWAGELGVEHPYASPIFGDLSGLPPRCIFIRGKTIFLHPTLNASAKKPAPQVAPATSGCIKMASTFLWQFLCFPKRRTFSLMLPGT